MSFMGHSFRYVGVGESRFYRHGVARPFSVRSAKGRQALNDLYAHLQSQPEERAA